MQQVMLSPYECANPNCTSHTTITGNQDTGGLSHIRHKGTWYTGYICKQCSSAATTLMSKTATRNAKLATQIYMAERRIEEKKPWTQPKPKKVKHLPPDELQRRNTTRQQNKQKIEFCWLSQWLDSKQLKKLFTDHHQLQAFAATYGYRKNDMRKLIEHKKP